MNLNKVLLTTDLSKESERPYAAVRELAKANGASVTLLHVVDDVAIAPHGAPLAPRQHSPDLPKRIDQAKQSLKAHVAKFEGLGIQTDVIASASAGEAIADYANDNGFDVLVMSTHGRSGLRRMIMGSVAESVLRHSETPVLVFPRKG